MLATFVATGVATFAATGVATSVATRSMPAGADAAPPRVEADPPTGRETDRGATSEPTPAPAPSREKVALAPSAERSPPADTRTQSTSDEDDGGGTSSRGRSRRGSPGSTQGSKKISLEEEFLIEGKLEKPSAYYILRRSRADYDWARLDAKFLPLVLESVQDPLF
jgi:hypothetical protein